MSKVTSPDSINRIKHTEVLQHLQTLKKAFAACPCLRKRPLKY